MIINRAITITSLLGGILAILLSVAFGDYIFALLAAAFFTFSLFLWKYGYLLIPRLTQAANIVEVRGNYIIPPSRDYVMKKTRDGYYVTKFLEIMLYESTLDKSDSEKRNLFESFEKALGSLKHTVKISFLLSCIDVSAYAEDVKTRRSEAEARKSKLSTQGPDAIRLDREIAMFNRQLDRLTAGERPMELIAYASTTSFGATKDEAVARAKRQAQEIRTILSSTLAADVRELSDLDMIKCLEWEYFVPAAREELLDEVF